MPSEFKLELMQPPFDMVGAREALRWLREDFEAYHAVVVHGFYLDDAEDRTAYEALCLDVATVVRACAEAIAQKQPISLTFDESAQGNDVTEMLARLAHRGLEHSADGDGAFLQVYEELASQLAARLTKQRVSGG